MNTKRSKGIIGMEDGMDEKNELGQYPPGAIIEDEEAEFRKYYFGISGGSEKQKKCGGVEK